MGDAPKGMINPHRHHILEVNGRPGKHRTIVREGQEILANYDVDPLKGIENLTFAPNRGHVMSEAKYLVDDLRDAQQIGATRDEIINILEYHGQRASER